MSTPCRYCGDEANTCCMRLNLCPWCCRDAGLDYGVDYGPCSDCTQLLITATADEATDAAIDTWKASA